MLMSKNVNNDVNKDSPISSKRQSSNEAGVKEELGEFETVMQTRDEVCLEFSQPLLSLYQAMKTRKTFFIALIIDPNDDQLSVA